MITKSHSSKTVNNLGIPQEISSISSEGLILLLLEMASQETLENLAKFLDFGNYLNIIPFKVKREAHINYTTYNYVTCTSKKYFINFSFAVVVTIVLILVIVKELLLNAASMEIEVIVFMMTIISVSLYGLNPHIWLVWNIEPVASLVNTYVRWYYHLGKS